MSLFFRVMLPSDIDEILFFENKKLSESILDETERSIASWNARWRREALEHYLNLGWSFLARDNEQKNEFNESDAEGSLVGYFIAQPMMFLDGQTQSLWVEHLQYSSLQARDQLCDLAYRLCREKHFQKVLFPNANSVLNSIKQLKAETWLPQVIEVKTTKV